MAHLDHLHEASQYITICTTCLPLLMVLVCKKHQQSWRFETSTFNLTHTRFTSKVSQCLVFCQGCQSKYGFVFNQSLTLVPVVPNEISSHGCVLDSVHELCTRHNQEEREAVAIASSIADALQYHSLTITAVMGATHNTSN